MVKLDAQSEKYESLVIFDEESKKELVMIMTDDIIISNSYLQFRKTKSKIITSYLLVDKDHFRNYSCYQFFRPDYE